MPERRSCDRSGSEEGEEDDGDCCDADGGRQSGFCTYRAFESMLLVAEKGRLERSIVLEDYLGLGRIIVKFLGNRASNMIHLTAMWLSNSLHVPSVCLQL